MSKTNILVFEIVFDFAPSEGRKQFFLIKKKFFVSLLCYLCISKVVPIDLVQTFPSSLKKRLGD